jgi:hypothetical protein
MRQSARQSGLASHPTEEGISANSHCLRWLRSYSGLFSIFGLWCMLIS